MDSRKNFKKWKKERYLKNGVKIIQKRAKIRKLKQIIQLTLTAIRILSNIIPQLNFYYTWSAKVFYPTFFAVKW